MQEKLLKQGVLKPQDYLNSRQIVSDDWANLSEAAKSFNTDYADAMTRVQDGTAAMQETYQNGKYDAFMNIQDKDVFINPVDGRMYLTTSDGDGNIERDPASMLNVNAINARRKDKINKVNLPAEVAKATGALGEVVKALNADGVITRSDKRLNDMMLIGGVPMLFDDAKNDIIDSLMTSPRNNASILTDDVGGYTFTEVESEAGGKVIYLKDNGMGLLQPELTDDQLGVVRNNIDMEIEKQLGFSETSSYEADLRAKLKRQEMAQRERLAKKPKPDEGFTEEEAVSLNKWLDSIDEDNFYEVQDAAEKVGLIVERNFDVDKGGAKRGSKTPIYNVFDAGGGKGSKYTSGGLTSSRDIFSAIKSKAFDSKRMKPYLVNITSGKNTPATKQETKNTPAP